MVTNVLRVLHITDAHFGGEDFGGDGSTIRNNVAAEFRRSLGQMIDSQITGIDIVAITGDLVTGGRWDDARHELQSFFKGLRDTLEQVGSTPLYFFVPGNHDLERTKLSPAETDAIINWDKQQQVRQALWTRSPDCSLTPRIYDAFSKYSDCIVELQKLGLVTLCDGCQTGVLPGDYSASFERKGLKVGVMGLNSAFLQFDRNAGSQPADARLAQATATIPERNLATWGDKHDICLLLTHHDSGEFLARDLFLGEVDRPGRFAAHLCGDKHDPKHESRSEYHSSQRFTILGNALNGLRSESSGNGLERRHGFSITEFARIGDQQIHRSAIFGWSKEGHEFASDMAFPRNKIDEIWGRWMPFGPGVGAELTELTKRNSLETDTSVMGQLPTAIVQSDNNTSEAETLPEKLEPHTDDEVESVVEHPDETDLEVFLKQESLDVRNPYQGLTYHKVGDKLYGRDDQLIDAVEALQARFAASKDNLPVIRIIGVSGSGKSSFLHAGLITDLSTAKSNSDIIAVSVRFLPSQWANADLLSLLLRLFENLSRVNSRLGLELQEISRLHQNPMLAGKLAGRLLNEKVRAMESSKLVIGIDQFEELIDALQGDIQVSSVSVLLECVDTAIQMAPSSIGLAYTLETSREAALKTLYQKGLLGDTYAPKACESISMDDSSDVRFIKGIITDPFRDAGYPLDRAVAKDLIDDYKSLTNARTIGRSEACALLPLVSLRLFKLFERVKSVMEPIREVDATPRLPRIYAETNDENGYVTKDVIGTDIGFASVIDEIGNIAWERATGDPEIELIELNHILQPLVGLDGESLELFDVPEPAYHQDREKFRALSEARLLTLRKDGSTTRYRLAHETILRHWKPAAVWLEKAREYLEIEQRARARAQLWDSEGRPDLSVLGVTSERILEAAMVLWENFRLWSMTNPDLLRDRVLLDFCIEVFSQSTDPLTETPRLFNEVNEENSGREARTIATFYGLTSLLEKYGCLEPDIISDCFGSNCSTLLHRASWAQPDLTRTLLQSGARHDIEDSTGWLPISGTIGGQNFECFLMFAEHAVVNLYANVKNKLTMASYAARYDGMDVIERIIEIEGMQVLEMATNNGWLPIHQAAVGGAINAMHFILKHSETGQEPIGTSGLTALHIACFNRRGDFVTALIGDLSTLLDDEDCCHFVQMEDEKRGATALWDACYYLVPGAVRSLLQYATPSKARRRKIGGYDHAIHAVFAFSHSRAILSLTSGDDSRTRDEDRIYEVLKILFKHSETDVNAIDVDGRSPLELAEGLPRVQALILNHPDLRALDPVSEGHATPLVLAGRYGQWVAVRRMLEKHRDAIAESPDVLIDKEKSISLLHLAVAPAAFKILPTMLELVRNDAGTVFDKNGNTPGRLAILRNNPQALKMLVDRFGPECLARENTPNSSLFESAMSNEAHNEQMFEILASSAREYAVERDKLGWTTFHVACFSQSVKFIKLLCDSLGTKHPAWELRDEFDRRPVDLLHPSLRSELLPETSGEMAPWPEGLEWDSTLTWVPLDADSRQEFIEHCESLIDSELEVTAEAMVDQAWPDFYGGRVSILRIRDEAWPTEHLAIYYLKNESGDLYRLNGTSPPIHEVNAKESIEVTNQNVLDYLRFFCFFVRGEEGPFFIFESRHAVGVPGISDQDEQRKVNQLAIPPRLCSTETDSGVRHCSGIIWYSNAIFLAKFSVQPTGMIDLFEDISLLDNLSCRPIAPIKVSKF